MENKTRGNGKTKKVVIGVATIVAVAAIAVPTALTLSGGNGGNAGASGSESNKYNIIVSTGHESVPDYSLSIEKGTTINELKSLLKAIDGYTITGIYKNAERTEQYLDGEIVSSDAKIYIEFTAITYKVNIFAEDKVTLLDSMEVSYKDSISLVAPSKAEDDFATYEFKGWFNERNEQVNLNEITSDLNIHPEFRTIMKEYRIGFINSNNQSDITVKVGDKLVTLNDTYHYGSKVRLRANQALGKDIIEFKVKASNGETIDVLTEMYRYVEDDQVYYEIELVANGDLTITYNVIELQRFSLGSIPDEVCVVRNGKQLTSESPIYYGDQLTIKYYEDYDVESFEVDGATLVSGDIYSVSGDVKITFVGTYLYPYLEFAECDGGYELVRCNNSEPNLVIPETYKGKEVVGVGDDFWINNVDALTCNIYDNGKYIGNKNNPYLMLIGAVSNEIVNIEINENCKFIYNSAFQYCYSLTSVEIPDSVKSIGMYAFDNCTSLSSFVIGNGLKSISRGMLQACSSLTSIIIPSSITSIREYALYGCNNLDTIIVSKENKIFTSRDLSGNEVNAIINKTTKTLVLGTTIIPSDGSVTSIGELAFCDNNFTEIVIPHGIVTIGESAFSGCRNLNSVIIPSSVISIGMNAFFECVSLTNVELSEGLQVISHSVFYNCQSLTEIIIPNSVTRIEDAAFSNVGLKEINIPQAVTFIGTGAFSCENLKLIIVNNSYVYSIILKSTENSMENEIFGKNATTIRVLKSVDDGSNIYLNGSAFTKSEEGEYNIYKEKEYFLVDPTSFGGYYGRIYRGDECLVYSAFGGNRNPFKVYYGETLRFDYDQSMGILTINGQQISPNEEFTFDGDYYDFRLIY